MKPKTIIDLFYEPISNRSRNDALMFKHNEVYSSYSSEEVRFHTECLATGLINAGLSPGDKVALISENRPEWLFSDIAILLCHAINVPIYPTLPAAQLEELLNDCGAKFIIVSTMDQLAKVEQIQDKLSSLQLTIVMDLEYSNCEEVQSLKKNNKKRKIF